MEDREGSRRLTLAPIPSTEAWCFFTQKTLSISKGTATTQPHGGGGFLPLKTERSKILSGSQQITTTNHIPQHLCHQRISDTW